MGGETMKTDRELLELAAKAAGIAVHIVGDDVSGSEVTFYISPDMLFWNPLTDDGDALRLAVKLHFDLLFHWNGCDDQYDEVEAYTHGAKKDAGEVIGFYLNGGQVDEGAATRRAIVRAAAAIGEAMP
jgi:hypothetical protein